MACLTLAAKLEECHVPLLSEFQSSDQYCFDNNTMQRTELLILTTLGWRMRSVTPFPYLNYMVSKLHSNLQPKDLVFRATQIIFWAIESEQIGVLVCFFIYIVVNCDLIQKLFLLQR